MVNQIDGDPSRLSHFTLPAERAKSTEKFRVSPPVDSRPEKFETPRPGPFGQDGLTLVKLPPSGRELVPVPQGLGPVTAEGG